jgi:hypothetical protein
MDNKTHVFKLSVLLLREGDTWIAQCLDYDLAAQGKSIKAARNALARTFAGQVALDLHHGLEPLNGFSQAPKEFWDKFSDAERLQDRQPIVIPDESLPPRVHVNALADDLRIAA